MKTLIHFNGYKIEFNGSRTYFLSNIFDCVGTFNTLRQAKNAMNRRLKCENKPLF